MSSGSRSSARLPRVLLYSDKGHVRQQVQTVIGRRPAADLPELEYVECATEPVVLRHMDSGAVDLAIFDGEASPVGGFGLCRQMKSEIYRCPPIVVLMARPQDAWLGNWSQADALVQMPPDPFSLPETVAQLLRRRVLPAAGEIAS